MTCGLPKGFTVLHRALWDILSLLKQEQAAGYLMLHKVDFAWVGASAQIMGA